MSKCASKPSDSGKEANSYVPVSTNCLQCLQPLQSPKLLDCFHVFCKHCLESVAKDFYITCPVPSCSQRTDLPAGVNGLPDDNISVYWSLKAGSQCTACKGQQAMAVARCYQCSSTLCHNCTEAHVQMHCFAGHRIERIPGTIPSSQVADPLMCSRHGANPLTHYCYTCNILICKDCILPNHSRNHDYRYLVDAAREESAKLQECRDQARVKIKDLDACRKEISDLRDKICSRYEMASKRMGDIKSTFIAMVENRWEELVRELEEAYRRKKCVLTNEIEFLNWSVTRMQGGIDYIDRVASQGRDTDVLTFRPIIEERMGGAMQYCPNVDMLVNMDLEFVSAPQVIQTAVRNAYGYLRDVPNFIPGPTRWQDINYHSPQQVTLNFPRIPVNQAMGSYRDPAMGQYGDTVQSLCTDMNQLSLGPGFVGYNEDLSGGPGLLYDMSTHSHLQLMSEGHMMQATDPGDATFPEEGFHSALPAALHEAINNDLTPTGAPPHLSNRSTPHLGSNTSVGVWSGAEYTQMMSDHPQTLLRSRGYPPKIASPDRSKIVRQKMAYLHKFGEYGVGTGQFKEPSGLAVNMEGDMLVCDTNSNRIHRFDRNGKFICYIGHEGMFHFPNRIAVMPHSRNIAILERAPLHQVKVVTPAGSLLNTFGKDIIDHPRSMAVDNLDRIIIVECQDVKRVVIFTAEGSIYTMFSIAHLVEFPFDVAVNDKEEIFVLDNRYHHARVFNYKGQVLRDIGEPNVTHFPIGVAVSKAGHVVIADNHNNFNVTVFDSLGTRLAAFESKVKHAQCFATALMGDDGIVVSSKDYRIYVYKYILPIQE